VVFYTAMLTLYFMLVTAPVLHIGEMPLLLVCEALSGSNLTVPRVPATFGFATNMKRNHTIQTPTRHCLLEIK
jgi:hypothetical protein